MVWDVMLIARGADIKRPSSGRPDIITAAPIPPEDCAAALAETWRPSAMRARPDRPANQRGRASQLGTPRAERARTCAHTRAPQGAGPSLHGGTPTAVFGATGNLHSLRPPNTLGLSGTAWSPGCMHDRAAGLDRPGDDVAPRPRAAPHRARGPHTPAHGTTGP